MAQYDFFTQPQGPDIDISLFGDAAIQGAKLGEATPTGLTSAIRGVTEGIDTGLGLAQKYENIQATRARTKNEEAIARINEMRAELQAQTQDIDITSTTLDLKNKIANSKLEAQNLKVLNGIGEDISSEYPAVRKSVFTNPDYQNYLLQHPDYAEGVMGRLAQDMTPEEQEKAFTALNFGKKMAYDQQVKVANEKYNGMLGKQVDKAAQDVATDSGLRGVTVGMTLNEIQQDIEAFPVGQKQTDTTGKIIADNPVNDYAGVKEFEVFKKGQKTGDILTKEEYGKLYTLKDSYARSLGSTPPTLGARGQTQIGGSQATPRSTPNPVPQPSSTPLLTAEDQPVNNNIITQRQKEFKELAKSPPAGIQAGSIERQLQEKKEQIRRQFTGYTPNISPTPQPMSNPMPLPPIPPKSSAALSSVAKVPVTLKTEVDHFIDEKTWNLINNEPLLNKESSIIKGLATVESRGRRGAISPTRTKGLLQVTEETAAELGFNRNIPEQNVLAGKKYIYKNIVDFNGNLRLALTAYNAGPGTVKKAVKEAKSTDWADVKRVLKENLSSKKWEEVEHFADKVISSSVKYMQAGNLSDMEYLTELRENGLVV